MAFVSNKSIEIVLVPEGTATAEYFVSLLRRKRLPCLYDCAEALLIARLDHRMDVIWHHAPGKQAITFAVEVEEGLLNHCCDLGVAQPTGTKATVKPTVSFSEAVGQLCQLLSNRSWEAIGQAKGYKLNRFGRIEMR